MKFIMLQIFNFIDDQRFFFDRPFFIDGERDIVVGYNGKRYVISIRPLKD